MVTSMKTAEGREIVTIIFELAPRDGIYPPKPRPVPGLADHPTDRSPPCMHPDTQVRRSLIFIDEKNTRPSLESRKVRRTTVIGSPLREKTVSGPQFNVCADR